MQDFESLKTLWTNEPVLKPVAFSNKSRSTKLKLEHQLFYGALALVASGTLIILMAIFGNFGFIHWYTYGGMLLAAMVCYAQAGIMYYGYRKVHRIDESSAPAEHLSQWENYYAYRKLMLRFNMPIYFIVLNLAMGVYFYEIFSGRPILNVLLFVGIYAGWMLFAIFYLGRKAQKREESRLQSILDELKLSSRSFDDKEYAPDNS